MRGSMRYFCVVLTLFLAQPGRTVGQAAGETDSVAVVDTLAAVERARLHLQQRGFAAAYEAAEEAALEAGLARSSTNLILPDSVDPTFAASVLLYRGLSLELQRFFPEASSDYHGFLRLESGSSRSRELRTRLPYVEAQSVRTLARRYRDEGVIAPNEAFAAGARYSVAVFPLFNESSLLAMSQMAFGITGVLRTVMSLIEPFADRDVPTVPYAHVRWVLDEILPQEVYEETEELPASELARILDADHLVVGRLNEVIGSLTANLTIGRAATPDPITLTEVQSSYSPTGLQNLQIELALALADSIQAATGFTYQPSREAFVDSIRHYLISDVDQFIDYGFAIEQLLIGDPVEGRVLLMDIDHPIARRDLEEANLLFAGESPPEDNLFELTATPDEIEFAVRAAYEDSLRAAALAAATADSVARVRQQPTEVRRPTRSRRTAREVIVGSATASRVLGGAGVAAPAWDAFYAPGYPADDPRSGKSGTLDPTRQKAGIPIRIEIPVPREPSGPDRTQR